MRPSHPDATGTNDIGESVTVGPRLPVVDELQPRSHQPDGNAGLAPAVFAPHDLTDGCELHAGFDEMHLEVDQAAHEALALEFEEQSSRADVPGHGPKSIAELDGQRQAFTGLDTLFFKHA